MAYQKSVPKDEFSKIPKTGSNASDRLAGLRVMGFVDPELHKRVAI